MFIANKSKCFRKKILRNIIIGCSILLVVPLSGITYGATSPSNQQDATVIVKDAKSKAVILKNRGIYYYGMTSSGKVINQAQIHPDEIIVKYKTNKAQTQKFQITLKDLAFKTRLLNGSLGLNLVKVTKTGDYFATLQSLSKNPEIEYAEPNYIAQAEQVPNDPYFSRQWGVQAIHAEIAWDKVSSQNRAGITIAILDTGINPNHEDLQASIIQGFNTINNDTNTRDMQGHGTHVAGIAAAVANNGKGIAGIASGSKIMPIKVLSDSGSGSYSDIINGIKYAVDHGANVISMSLGGPGKSQAMQDAIDYATSRGVTVIAASGNQNGPVYFPGNCNGVITVGAIDSRGTRASYSNYGPELDVLAPGTQITSSYIGNYSSYTNMSGTSMATPFVAGVAALVKAANPNLSPAAVTDIIRKSAADLGNPGFDNYTGYGLTDANRAIDLANQGSGNPVPTQPPSPVPSPAPQPTPAPIPVPLPLPGTNLALGKVAMASTVEGTTRQAAQAVDGNPSTRWASRPGIDPQWISVDLGKVYNIKQIILKWETAYAKSYQIQVSNNGVNWVSVYRTTTGTGGATVLTGSVNTRFVRMLGTQRGTTYGYSLWEFEIYGS